MKRNIFLKISIAIVSLIVLFVLLKQIVLEPWFRKKIETAFNENSVDYNLKIGKAHLSVFKSGIELENIIFHSVDEQNGLPDLTGMIASVKFKGINLWKALFDNDFEMSEVAIFDSRIIGKIPLEKQTKAPKISTLNIRIDSLFFDKLGIDIKDSSTATAYSIIDGSLKLYNCQVAKQDTFSTAVFKKFDFDAQELQTVTADSMYTFTATGIDYSSELKMLMIRDYSIHPNYKNYNFTSRHWYETDRIDADLKNIRFYDFAAANFLKSKSLVSSYIEIGEMDVDVFRDKQKPFKHLKKPVFQEMIYNFPGVLDVDSIGILSGNISYTEHTDKAKMPGTIMFNQFKAKLYKITNEPIYKTEKAFFEFKAEALLMGKGKMVLALKAELFNDRNTFSVDGSLSKMEMNELNSMLENNAFMYVTSGTIDDVNFNFTANNTKALGKVTFLYHGLDIAIKNKQTDDTTGIKARVISFIANKKIMNSNPIPGEEVRIGGIDYERDPERFLFNYFFKSVLSGIKSSLVKTPGGRKK